MRAGKRFAAVAAIVALLTGCVSHTWAPGPQVSGDFGAVSGQCKLMSMGASSGGGFVAAAGNPRFVGAVVGASVLAGAIGSAVRQQNIYNACMEANGFVIADRPEASGGAGEADTSVASGPPGQCGGGPGLPNTCGTQ